VEKSWENLLPEVRLPLLNPVLSDVVVCVIPSLLVHVTVVPAVTVSVAGEKDIFTILTALETVGGGVVVVVLPLPLLLQEKTTIEEININNILRYNILFFIKRLSMVYGKRETAVAPQLII
jgi:hypothetical protein